MMASISGIFWYLWRHPLGVTVFLKVDSEDTCVLVEFGTEWDYIHPSKEKLR